MNKNEGSVYYFPPIRSFKDTGVVAHSFADGSKIAARVEKSSDSYGFCIHLMITDGNDDVVCDFTMDRLSALCLIDCINRNILNQEELLYTKDEGENNDDGPVNK